MMTMWLFFIFSLVLVAALCYWIKVHGVWFQSNSHFTANTDTVTAIKHALLQSNLSAIVAIDKDDKIIEFNPSAERLFKRKRQDVLGSTMAELIIPLRYRKMHYAGMKHFKDTGIGPVLRKRIEVSALNAEGSEFPIEMEITPIASGNDAIFVAVINDISERENSRKNIVDALALAEEANRAKSIFLTSVSHEIRSPLHEILSLIECLQHTALNDQQFKYVSTAQSAGERLLNMVNDILDLGQIEAGKRQVHLSLCHPRAILEEHLEIYRQNIAEKGLELYLIEADNVPRTISTDITMMRQILSNLLSNACKYTEHGGVTVRTSSRVDVKNGQEQIWWICEVQDTGVGLTPEQINALFQEFTRFHQDGSSSGSGVGLMISRLLAQQLGGELTVHSNNEAGTTFTLCLPIEASSPKRHFKQLMQLNVFLYSNNLRWRNCISQQLLNLGVTNQIIITTAELQTLPEKSIVIIDTQQNAAKLPFEPLNLSYQQQQLRFISAGDDLSADLADCPRHFAFIHQPYRRQDIIFALRAARSERKLAFNLTHVHKPQLMLAPSNISQAFHILLVDDSEVNRLTIRTFLGLEGIRVTEAANGEEAVNAVRTVPFDMILMDIRMPVMDGIEATTIIRRQQLAETTPIIALTAHVQEHEKQRCLAAGMQDFLTKPIGKAVLINRVMHWLSNIKKADDNSKVLDESTVNQCKLLDETLLLNLQQDFTAAKFQNLLDTFLTEIEHQVSQVGIFLAEENFNRVEILVHAIKSSAHTFGAMNLSHLAKSIEEACQQKQWATVQKSCPLLDDIRQQTEAEFKRSGYGRSR